MSERSREIIVRGSLKYKNNVYEISNTPLTDKQWKQKTKLKSKYNCTTGESSESSEYYELAILDNKLFLENISFAFCNKEVNIVKEMFGTERVSCDWFSGEIACLVSSESIQVDSTHTTTTTNVMLLTFKNGVLVDEQFSKRIRERVREIEAGAIKKFGSHKIQRKLKNYIEE